MTRRPPPDPSEFLEYKGRAPRWLTPLGVVARRLAPGEINHEPVLACERCNYPQIHYSIPGARAACRACGTERKW